MRGEGKLLGRKRRELIYREGRAHRNTLLPIGPMHGESFTSAKPADTPGNNRYWFQLLSRYHWFVLVVAALGWLFDTMDQQLFTLARVPAMRELIKPPEGLEPAEFNSL